MTTTQDTEDLVKRLLALANCEANELADALTEAATTLDALQARLDDAGRQEPVHSISTEHCTLEERKAHQASVNFPSDDLYCPRCGTVEKFLSARKCEPHIVPVVEQQSNAALERRLRDALDELDALRVSIDFVAGRHEQKSEHTYWGAGEPDCPKDIKGSNGELFMLRCKKCGKDNPRSAFCASLPAPQAAAQSIGEPDKLEQIIDAFIESYELRGDGDYTPSENERVLIKDAFMGLLADSDWDAAWGAHITAIAQSQAAAPQPLSDELVAFIGGMDFESLKLRGRCTATLYREQVDSASNEIALYTRPSPQIEALQPLTDDQIECGRKATFSIDNPFCPCTDKTMRKAVRWAESAHGIGANP